MVLVSQLVSSVTPAGTVSVTTTWSAAAARPFPSTALLTHWMR